MLFKYKRSHCKWRSCIFPFTIMDMKTGKLQHKIFMETWRNTTVSWNRKSDPWKKQGHHYHWWALETDKVKVCLEQNRSSAYYLDRGARLNQVYHQTLQFSYSCSLRSVLRCLLLTQYNPACSLVSVVGSVLNISLERADTAALKIWQKNL